MTDRPLTDPFFSCFVTVVASRKVVPTPLYKNGGGWAMHFDEAEKFPDIASVITTKVRYGLECVTLVLVLHDQPCPQVDVVLPLEDKS